MACLIITIHLLESLSIKESENEAPLYARGSIFFSGLVRAGPARKVSNNYYRYLKLRGRRVQVKGSSKVITTSSSCICAHTIVNNLAKYSGFGSQHDSAPQSSRNRLLQPVGFSSGIIEPWTGHRQNGVVPSILDRFSKEKWKKSYHSTVQPHRASPKPESSAAHTRVRAEQTGEVPENLEHPENYKQSTVWGNGGNSLLLSDLQFVGIEKAANQKP